MKLEMRQLETQQLQIYLDILMERALWLERINQPMWNTSNLNPISFEKMYPNNRPYLLYNGDEIVGGFILVKQDGFLWSESENLENAFYIHKLVIKPMYSGRGYAKESLNLIKNLAKSGGVDYLRLDCYGDRANLIALYEDSGFYNKRDTVMDDGIVLKSYEWKCE